MENIDNLENYVESALEDFKKTIKFAIINIDDLKKNLNKKHEELDRKESDLIDKNNELEQFRKVSFIGAMNKQILEKDNQISILKKKVNFLKRELEKIKAQKDQSIEEDEEELDVYEEEINGKTFYITDGEKNYIYEMLKGGDIGETKLGEIKDSKVIWY